MVRKDLLTSEELSVGVDEIKDCLDVGLVAHRVHVDHVVLRRRRQEALEARTEHHVEDLAAEVDRRAAAHRAHLFDFLRVEEGLVEIEHQVQLPSTQLVLRVRQLQLLPRRLPEPSRQSTAAVRLAEHPLEVGARRHEEALGEVLWKMHHARSTRIAMRHGTGACPGSRAGAPTHRAKSVRVGLPTFEDATSVLLTLLVLHVGTYPRHPFPGKRNTNMLRGLLVATLAASAWALSPTLEGLRSTPLVRASDAASVSLPTLWRAQTPFGIADEVSVCAFLRHFG